MTSECVEVGRSFNVIVSRIWGDFSAASEVCYVLWETWEKEFCDSSVGPDVI